jgi:hypothetical protein
MGPSAFEVLQVISHICLCITTRFIVDAVHLCLEVEELGWKVWLRVARWEVPKVMIYRIREQEWELFSDQIRALYEAQCAKTHFGKHFESSTF